MSYNVISYDVFIFVMLFSFCACAMLIFIHDGHLFEFLFKKLGICYFLKLNLTLFAL